MAYINFQPSDFFNTLLWTGNGTSSSRSLTGVGFQPDFTWIKPRTSNPNATHHQLYDSNRGTGKSLRSSGTDAEITNSAYGYLSSFDSDGFSSVAGSNNNENINETGATFVAWNWKANGGTTGTQSGGTISATVQKDTARGFSIGTYTGTGSSGTVETGLTSALQLVFVKRTNSTADWAVGVGSNITTAGARYLCLNSTDAFKTSGENPGERQHGTINIINQTTGYFQVNTSATDAVDVGANGSSYIFYAWHSVKGYSKIDKYTGNGSANGPFIYTGFRPAFVIYKRSDAVENWQVLDAKRDIDNPVGQQLYPNLSASEGTENRLDFLSNGFKLRNSGTICNASGGTYIYMAFAEFPVVGSNGIAGTAR